MRATALTLTLALALTLTLALAMTLALALTLTLTTGGTSVMSYLSTGTVLFDYIAAIPCFARALHADLFRKGDHIAATPPAWCLPKLLELAAAPRNKTVAVEFHDYSIPGYP